VVIEARSEPMPGSVMATAVINSPEQMPGNHRCFCSSLVRWRKYGRQMSLWSVMPSPLPPIQVSAASSMMTVL
jgi:hypothetical protein